METDSMQMASTSSDISARLKEVEKEIAHYTRLLEEQHEMKQCRVCMDKEFAAVFMPCAHLLACGVCAASLTQCPLCRSDVHYTVQVSIRADQIYLEFLDKSLPVLCTITFQG